MSKEAIAMIGVEPLNALRVAQDHSVTDEQIVSRVLAGEVDVFEVLMRRHNQRLFRISRSIVRTDEDAEDVVQEAYLQAYCHLADFEGRSKFSTWLTKIAVHEALAKQRRVRRRFPAVGAEDGDYVERLASPDRDPEREVVNDDLGRILEGAVDSLPASYRSVFVLRHIEGLDTADTADYLGLGQEAVKTRLHRARSLLQRRLQERIGEATPLAFRFLGARCDRLTQTVLQRLRYCRPRPLTKTRYFSRLRSTSRMGTRVETARSCVPSVVQRFSTK
jgi:RNA polymerase sigma-70 factor (ECF subfamily)